LGADKGGLCPDEFRKFLQAALSGGLGLLKASGHRSEIVRTHRAQHSMESGVIGILICRLEELLSGIGPSPLLCRTRQRSAS